MLCPCKSVVGSAYPVSVSLVLCHCLCLSLSVCLPVCPCLSICRGLSVCLFVYPVCVSVCLLPHGELMWLQPSPRLVQILTCMLLSLSFCVSAVGVMFPAACITYIWHTGSVHTGFPMLTRVCAAGAVMMFVGAVISSKRLMPVTGEITACDHLLKFTCLHQQAERVTVCWCIKLSRAAPW